MIPLNDLINEKEHVNWDEEQHKARRLIDVIMEEILSYSKLTKKKREETEVIVSVITSFMFQFVWNQTSKAENRAVSRANKDAKVQVVEVQLELMKMHSELQEQVIELRQDLLAINGGHGKPRSTKEPLKKKGNVIQFPVKKGGRS